MSTQQTHYVMLGNKFGYDEFYEQVKKRIATVPSNDKMSEDELDTWRETIEEKHSDSAYDGINNHNGVCIISDGCDGRYVCVGYVLAKSGELNDLQEHTAQWYSNWDDIGDNIVRAVGFAEDIEILAFTHYR